MTAYFETELPAVYLDALTTEASPERLLACNRHPEPGGTDARLNSPVEVMLLDTGGSSPDLTRTTITIGGVAAYRAGAAISPWSVTIAALGSNGKRLVLTRTTPFDSEQVVTVRVQSTTVDDGATLDTSWSFTCQDLTAPRVVSATPRDAWVVRVVFSEAMGDSALYAGGYTVRAVRPELLGVGATDPTTVATYLYAALDTPAYSPSVASVERVDSTTVDLVLAAELSSAAPYRVDVVGVRDVAGNEALWPYVAASFTSLLWPMPAERSFDLFAMIPIYNRRTDSEQGDVLKKFIGCLQEMVNLLLWHVDRFTEILDPDTAPDPFVSTMLADLGCPFVLDGTDAVNRRQLTRELVQIYSLRGTEPGVLYAARVLLGLEIVITPQTSDAMVLGESYLGSDWVLGRSDLEAAFSFDVTSPALTDVQRARLRSLVERMRPLATNCSRYIEV